MLVMAILSSMSTMIIIRRDQMRTMFVITRLSFFSMVSIVSMSMRVMGFGKLSMENHIRDYYMASCMGWDWVIVVVVWGAFFCNQVFGLLCQSNSGQKGKRARI
ncbi:hypothetical protein CEXT_278011 [Caerostris extrusa]|uniref:Uncharacterized protein n=1 Tax=Caerostris extrusa TaxID=172846 RepID=A0AAV4XWF5_CAEEX|nr:hypothetical protein CEXT_278011 [Caerostris extrusa]